MVFKQLLTAAFGLLATLYFALTVPNASNVASVTVTPIRNDTTNIPRAISLANVDALQHCDSTCVRRLLFKTSYSSAAMGINMVFNACNAHNWCASDEQDWCPDAVNSTITSIADRVIAASLDIDYENINNITLLSTMSSLSSKSARVGISWAQSLATDGLLACHADRWEDLRRIQWYISREEGTIDYDARKFDQEIAEQGSFDGSVTDSNEKTTDVQAGDDDNDHENWAIALPFLTAPGILLGGLVEKGECFDSILCSYAPFLQRFFKTTQSVLQDVETSSILSKVLDASTVLSGTVDVPSINDPFQIPSIPEFIGEHLSEWWDNELDTTRILEQFKSGAAQEDVPAGFPPPPPNVDPQAVSDGSSMPSLPGPPYKFVSPDLDHPPLRLAPKNFELYRLQKYNVFTDTLQQMTVTPATGPGVEKEMQQRASQEGELRNWRPFDVLDSWGKVMNRIWADPKNLAKMPGLWRKQRELFFPVESDLPILDCLGEPLAASAAGTLITLKPAACDVGRGAPTQFSIFLAEGGQIKVRSVIFDPRSGAIEVGDELTGEECYPKQESEIPVIPGCQTIQGCRRCIRDSGCFIGILPPDCVGNPVDVSAALPPARWQYCRELLRSPDFTREQRKAWAIAITPQSCLSYDEWHPLDITYAQYRDYCSIATYGWEDFREAVDAWVSGLLPLACPYDKGDGSWEEYGKDLKKNCERVAEILHRPFPYDH